MYVCIYMYIYTSVSRDSCMCHEQTNRMTFHLLQHVPVLSHMNKACHIRMSHVTYERVMSHMHHVTHDRVSSHMNESCNTEVEEISTESHTNESCHVSISRVKYARVMSHMNKSRHI